MKLLRKCLFITVLASCTWAHKTAPPRGLASMPQQCRNQPQGGFTIDRFISIVRNNPNIRSVEDALCLIPQSVRSQYVLVHNSSSAQSSRPKSPRAILFNTVQKNGIHEMQYAISFNGDPKDSNFHNIEVMKVNRHAVSNQQHFEYIDIAFSPDGRSRPHVSNSNPQECMMCHGVHTNRARPIWDAKGFTPLVYGRSTFGGSVGEEPHLNDFRSFVKNAPEHSRYSMLEGLEDIKVGEGQRLPALEMANSVFGEGLGSVNNRRVARLLKETPNYNKYKYAILGALLNCPNSPGFVPERLRTDHSSLQFVNPHFHDAKNKSLDEIFKGFIDLQKASQGFSSAGFAANTASDLSPEILPFHYDINAKTGSWVGDAGPAISKLRWLIEGRGISMVEWAMDVPVDGHLGFYRLINSRNFKAEDIRNQNPDNWRIAQELLQQDRQLASTFRQVTGMSFNQLFRSLDEREEFPQRYADNFVNLCHKLKGHSLKALSSLQPRSSSPEGVLENESER